MSPFFDKYIFEAAQSFERYIDEYNHQKIKSEQDLHFYSSVKNAKKEFSECKGEA
jgi:hypothetical protein